MMNQAKAIEILNQWLGLLNDIEQVEIDCEMSPELITENLDRRQQTIDRIQQLDASLMSVREFRFSQSPDLDTETLDRLMESGKQTSGRITQQNRQTIEIAKKKRLHILGKLKTNTLSRGYLATNQAPKIRPPAIVDGNA